MSSTAHRASAPARTTVSGPGRPEEMFGSGHFLPIADALLFEPSVSPGMKWVLAVAISRQKRGARLASRSDIRLDLPFAHDELIGAARVEAERSGIATFDRRRQAAGIPPSLAYVERRFDPFAGSWYTVLPVALARRLDVRNGARLADLAALYHLEQHKRGAVHIGDAEAAFRLGLPVAWVTTGRRKLVALGCLEQIERPGKGTPPVYLIPGTLAMPKSKARPDQLDKARTRTIAPIATGIQPAFWLYGSSAEADLVRSLVAGADAKSCDWLASMVEAVHGAKGGRAILDARAILDELAPGEPFDVVSPSWIADHADDWIPV